MKITTAGRPSSSREETTRPDTASGKEKLGRGVPSGNMVDGVRAISNLSG
jgi:hypothetical protein